MVGLEIQYLRARSQETLIVNTQGGEYQELVERVVIRPFEKKLGVKVIHDGSEGPQPGDVRRSMRT